MEQTRNGADEINKACASVINLTDADFEDAYRVANEQLEYTHPFKMVTARWQNELGAHNTKVLNALQVLRDTILQGKGIRKP